MSDIKCNRCKERYMASANHTCKLPYQEPARPREVGEGASHLAAYIEQAGIPASFDEAVQERNQWIETAAMFSRNEDYYRGLLDEIAAHIGPEAWKADSGEIVDDEPVRARLPDLVAARLSAHPTGDDVERVARAILAADEAGLLDRDGYPEREAEAFARSALSALSPHPAAGEVERLKDIATKAHAVVDLIEGFPGYGCATNQDGRLKDQRAWVAFYLAVKDAGNTGRDYRLAEARKRLQAECALVRLLRDGDEPAKAHAREVLDAVNDAPPELAGILATPAVGEGDKALIERATNPRLSAVEPWARELIADLAARIPALSAEVERLKRSAKLAVQSSGKAIARAEAAEALAEERGRALEPFAKVCAAFDYWVEEAMPDFAYPVSGANTTLALRDAPDAVGALHESDFRRARAALQPQQGGGENG